MTGKEIKELREKAGLTQKEFAEILGCTIFSISGWELGRRSPDRAYTKLLNKIKQNSSDSEREITLKPGETLIIRGENGNNKKSE